MSSTLLVVYDAEDPACRRRVDWIGRHDRDGLVVTFPYLNPELVRMAPELAGLAFPGQLYILDLESRAVRRGPEAVPELLHRLPVWSWASYPARLPWLARVIYRFLGR